MARMIPSTIHPSVRSMAEKKLFALLRDASGTEDWVCLHSLGMAHHDQKRRGEIDFLLLTSKGIFVLEIKGGRVSRESGIWRFTDRFGVVHEKNESPFDQAAGAMFSLARDVRNHFSDEPRFSRLLWGFGVMFPDIAFDAIGPEFDRRQVYDAEDRRVPIGFFIGRLAAYWKERSPDTTSTPTRDDISALVDFLRGDFDLIPSLYVQAETAASHMLSLEKEQYAVLDIAEQFRTPRVLVEGGAGTGKTLLAAEIARREAKATGEPVLFLCFNRLLADFLENNLKREHQDGKAIIVRSVYRFLYDAISRSSLAEEFTRKTTGENQDTIYRELLPDYGSLAILESHDTSFKTLIMDEAQDMMTDRLLDAFDLLLDGGLEAGRWWVFCDVNNQAAVYGSFDDNAYERLTKFGKTLLLPTNRRNTIPIANETAMLTLPKIWPRPVVDGLPVKYTWYDSNQEQPDALAKILRGLLSEKIQPHRITVLSPRKPEECSASRIDDPKIIHLTKDNVWECSRGNSRNISYSSISSFKGLENDFVVLTDLDDLDAEWWRSVIYVGMSRARLGLQLILKQSLRSIYEQRLRQWLGRRSSFDAG